MSAGFVREKRAFLKVVIAAKLKRPGRYRKVQLREGRRRRTYFKLRGRGKGKAVLTLVFSVLRQEREAEKWKSR